MSLEDSGDSNSDAKDDEEKEEKLEKKSRRKQLSNQRNRLVAVKRSKRKIVPLKDVDWAPGHSAETVPAINKEGIHTYVTIIL